MSKEKKVKKIPHESVQSNIKIAEIYRGVVITKDNRFIKIMEISPIPFNLYTRKERFKVARNFENVITQCPNNVQLTAITLPANLSAQKNFLDEKIANEEKSSLRRMAKEYKNVIINHELYSTQRRFFISFEFSRDYSMREVPTYDSICDNLNEKARQIEAALAVCGNTVIHHTLPEGTNDIYKAENEGIEEILYQILNRYSEQSYKERKEEVYKKYKEFAEEKDLNFSDIYISPSEYLSPFSIDFRNKNYVVVNNDTYYTFAYFPSDGYSTYVEPGWLTPYINTENGIDINIYFERDNSDFRRQKILNSIKYSKGDLYNAKEDTIGSETAEDALNAGRYLNNGLRNGARFYYATVMLTISGRTPEEVEKKYDLIQRMVKNQRLKIERYKYMEEQAFFSALPFGRMEKTLFQYGRRNMLESGASSMYPFTTPEFIDPHGILFGVDEASNDTPVMPNLWNNSMFTNMNVGIFGTSGGGKTVTTLTVATRLRMLQVPVILFACEKQHEYQRVTEAVGGQFISLATGTQDCINIMEILPHDETVNNNGFAEGESRSYLEAKVETLVEWVELKTGKLSPADETQLNIAIHNTYAKEPFCITEDNESLIDPLDPEGKKFKKMPTLEDLYNTLCENSRTKSIAEVMSYFVNGSGKTWYGQTNVDLTNKFIVFGLEGMSEVDFSVALYLAMDYVWAKIKEDAKEHKAVFFDEFWKVCKSPSAVKLATKMIRLVRAYNCSMVVATQSLDDLLKYDGGTTGKTLLDNTSTKMLLKTNEDNATMIGELLHLTYDQIKRLQTQQPGQCLFNAGGTYINLKIINGYVERLLFYTDDKTKEEWNKHKGDLEKMLFSNYSEDKEAEAYTQLVERMRKETSFKQSTLTNVKHANPTLANLLNGNQDSEEEHGSKDDDYIYFDDDMFNDVFKTNEVTKRIKSNEESCKTENTFEEDYMNYDDSLIDMIFKEREGERIDEHKEQK